MTGFSNPLPDADKDARAAIDLLGLLSRSASEPAACKYEVGTTAIHSEEGWVFIVASEGDQRHVVYLDEETIDAHRYAGHVPVSTLWPTDDVEDMTLSQVVDALVREITIRDEVIADNEADLMFPKETLARAWKTLSAGLNKGLRKQDLSDACLEAYAKIDQLLAPYIED
jgi:hypothetical protein